MDLVPRLLRLSLVALLALVFAGGLYADEAEPHPGEAELRQELEAEYRQALETRLARERENYEGSLRSLWIANAAVWACLLLFIAYQGLGWRKAMRKLERLGHRS